MAGVGEEAGEHVGVLLGRLHRGEVARATDQVERRAGNEVDCFAHQVGRRGAVLRPGDAERRQAERSGGGVEVRPGDGRGAAGIARRRLAHQHVAPEGELRHPPEGLGEPALHHRVGEALDAAGLDAAHPLGPDRGRANPGGGVRKHHRADQVGAPGREPLRDHATDREADEQALAHGQPVEQPFGVGDELVHRVRCRRTLAEAVPALVEADDPEPARQQRHDAVPEPQISSERVRENDRRPLDVAFLAIMEAEPVEIGDPHAWAPSPSRRARSQKARRRARTRGEPSASTTP